MKNLFAQEMEQTAIERIQKFAKIAKAHDFEIALGFTWLAIFLICSTSFMVLLFFSKNLIPFKLVVKLYIPKVTSLAKKFGVHRLLPSGI